MFFAYLFWQEARTFFVEWGWGRIKCVPHFEGLARKPLARFQRAIRPPVSTKGESMKVAVYLSNLRRDLKNDFKSLNIATNDVDCIIMEILNCSFTDLIKDRLLTTEETGQIMQAIKVRKSGKPVTKIFNKAYFYGLELYVDENVLSARQETELVVDKAIEFLKNRPAKVLDLCTGSGAIACAIKKMTNADVTATDISEKALEIAKRNAKSLGLDIEFKQSDMFKNITQKFDLIVSNPPYIETETCKTLDKEVKNYDPMLALDGGADGLDFYRTIKNNMKYLKDDGQLILEIGYNQGQSVCQIFKGYKTEIIKDYNNKDRIVVVKK